MAERWDKEMDRKLAPAKRYVSIVPLWLRIVAIAGAFAAAGYLAVEDRQPFRALWLLFSSYQLGFLITLLIFLVPVLGVIYALAALLHRRRKKQDFPTAVARERK